MHSAVFADLSEKLQRARPAAGGSASPTRVLDVGEEGEAAALSQADHITLMGIVAIRKAVA